MPRLRADYGNNSLVVPPRTPAPDAVAGLLYYDSIEQAGAPTHAAKARPGELTMYDDDAAPFNPPNSGAQAGRSRALLRRLYAEERPVRYRRGTCASHPRHPCEQSSDSDRCAFASGCCSTGLTRGTAAPRRSPASIGSTTT